MILDLIVAPLPRNSLKSLASEHTLTPSVSASPQQRPVGLDRCMHVTLMMTMALTQDSLPSVSKSSELDAFKNYKAGHVSRMASVLPGKIQISSCTLFVFIRSPDWMRRPLAKTTEFSVKECLIRICHELTYSVRQ